MKKIEKSHVGFVEGMYQGLGRDHSNTSNYKEADWNSIKEYIDANKDTLKSVGVGLAEDWTYTSGEVWNSKEGYIEKESVDVYTSSSWATPAMEVTSKDGDVQMFEARKHGNNPYSYFVFEV